MSTDKHNGGAPEVLGRLTEAILRFLEQTELSYNGTNANNIEGDKQ